MKLKSFICSLLFLALSVQLFACAAEEEQPSVTQSSVTFGTLDLMADVKPSSLQAQPITDSYAHAAANFAVSLLQNTYDGENCILSPYSVYAALAMTANGADAQTLAQMESVLGMTAAELNVYLHALAQNAGDELVSANSIWFRQDADFAPNADFLQINADYYGANLFGADFDAQTLADMNGWISEKTDGKIENALDRIDPMALMYLINALTFDASWQNEYHTENIKEGVFHGANGDETVSMMHSSENFYLEDALATGFMKDYLGGQYSFVAMLPNEGVSMQDYLASLSGEGLLSTIKNAQSLKVIAAMPKYTLEYQTELSDALSAMGMPEAFGNDADFSRMSNADVMIGRVLHQTYLTVDELGTQAGATTIVEMVDKSAIFNTRTVTLDRPFVMGIYDNVNQCFVFMGVIESVG